MAGNVFVDMAFNQHVTENGVLRAAIKNAYARKLCNIEQQMDAQASAAAAAKKKPTAKSPWIV